MFAVNIKSTPSPLKNDQCVKGESIDFEESKVSATVQPQVSIEDVVNVSQGFQLRTAYKKKGKGSKLDGLLERRVKQFALEERQRLEKLKQAGVSKLTTENGTKDQEKTSPSLNSELKTEAPSFEATKTVLSGKAANPMVKEKDPVVQKLEFDQDEQVTHHSSAPSENPDVGPGSSVKTEAAASVAEKEQKVAPEPEHNTGNGTLITNAELNGGSRKALEGSLNINSKTTCPKFEGTQKDTSENSSSVGENGLSIETTLPVHVNGRDGSVDSPPTNLTNNINSKEIKQGEEDDIKTLPSKDPLKSLMNGDLTQGSQNEKAPPNEETHMDKSNLEYLASQRVARLDSNTEGITDSAISSTPSQLSSEGTVKSDGLGNSTRVLPMEIEEAKVKTLSPSPILSMEESSLSSDVAENSTNSGSGVKTIVTQITTTTTTTTTVSTKSHSVEASSLADAATNSQAFSTLTSAASKVESTLSVSSLSTTTTTTTVTKVTTPTSGAKVTEQSKTVVTATFTDAKSAPSSTSVTSITLSKEYTTRDRVRLLKFSRCKKTRSGTALPSYRKFVTKSSKKSIFVLPNDDLKKLARRAGIREVPAFNYNAKPALDIWPYPSPRPTFGITWRSVTISMRHFFFYIQIR